MRFWRRSLIAIGALLASSSVGAQIYTCTAPDGTRIFSDEKCGPDAKVVPNITTKKTPARNTTGSRPKVEPKSTAELEQLLEQCNAGDMAACNTWTRGGGPNSLKQKELAAEKACEAGSVADCEYRYCAGHVNDECRARVLQAAKVAGDNWFLRDTGTALAGGSTRYDVRCLAVGAPAIREVIVTCSGEAGPNRCGGNVGASKYSRLDLAAAAMCAAK